MSDLLAKAETWELVLVCLLEDVEENVDFLVDEVRRV